MGIDDLSRKAVILYGYIQGCGGGALDEWKMRDKTGLSHGTICAARKELVDTGMLTLGKDGRRTTYILTSQSDQSEGQQEESDQEDEVDRKADSAEVSKSSELTTPAEVPPPPASKVAMIKTITHETPPQEAEMPRVAGTFNSFDDWLSTLTIEFGGCVNVSESLVTPHEYIVYCDEYDGEDRYIVTENEDGSVDVD